MIPQHPLDNFTTQRSQVGFTISELMMVIAIAAILAAIAIPSMSTAISNARAKAAAQALFITFQQARSEAISFNGLCDVSIAATDSSAPPDWSLGWQIVADNPGATTTCSYDHDFNGGTPNITVSEPLARWDALDRVVFTVPGDPASISYDRTGRLTATLAAITVCDNENKVFEREVQVDISGLPEVRLSETKCS